MARNSLENALRFQEHLGNQTTCHSCVVSQALNLKEDKEPKVYVCACGEIELVDNEREEVICPKCGLKMSEGNFCTRNKDRS